MAGATTTPNAVIGQQNGRLLNLGIILEIVSPDNYYTSNQLTFRYTKNILQRFALNIGGCDGSSEDLAKRIFLTFFEFKIQNPRMGTENFLFIWRHKDGSTVTFSSHGWSSTDLEQEAWLNAMNRLTSSVPTIAPYVRLWLEQECQLLEAHGPDLQASIPKQKPRKANRSSKNEPNQRESEKDWTPEQ